MEIEPKRILIIRRDNIGDLLCTTPAIRALRRRFPQAEISVLANSYNAPVLAGNPDIDHTFSYTKAKHAKRGKLRAWWNEWQLYRQLKNRRFDLIIQANPGPHDRTARLVRYLRGKHRLGVVNTRPDRCYNIALLPADIAGRHQVERVMSLLAPLGIADAPGPMILAQPAPTDIPATQRLPQQPGQLWIGIHISSRKQCNRWDIARFKELIAAFPNTWRAALFWSPGPKNDLMHPGDDEDAAALVAALPDKVLPFPTQSLNDLIVGLSQCTMLVCSDGGAMHIGAALGKPIVAFFGCTDPQAWGPWHVPNVVLHGNGNLAGISTAQTLAAVQQLVEPPPP